MEIVVDFGNDENTRVRLKSYNSELGTAYTLNPLSPAFDDYDRNDFDIFTIAVGAPTGNPVTTLPTSLSRIERIPSEEAVNADRPRLFELSPGRLEPNPAGDPPTLDITFTINGKAFDLG